MEIQQIRNATIIVESGPHRVLVDPMLARRHALPPLRLFGPTERNPTVELPADTDAALASITHCLITHCQKGHFDHLDRAGVRWLRERQLPVVCTPHDAPHLAKLGLAVQPLPDMHAEPSPFLGGTIRTVRCTHGRGLVGRVMEHGVGYLIALPGEPSLYLAGDTVLTSTVEAFVREHAPDVSVVPAGGARFDIGGEIIMVIDEVLAFTQQVRGAVVANHLEAISHCPVSRASLRAAAARAGIAPRLHVPEDGELMAFARAPAAVATSVSADTQRPAARL